MNAIHPGQLVISVFGLQSQKKSLPWRAVFNIMGAFLISAAILSFALVRFSPIDFTLSVSQDRAAYLPSQAISTQLTQGYLNLR